MTTKVHLQANSGENQAPYSFCASQLTSQGRVRFNGRRTYVNMSSTILRTCEFAATPAADRCAHCVDVLRQRKAMYPKTFARICGE